MRTSIFIVLIYIIQSTLGSSIASSHVLDPDYEMYEPIVRPWKLGLGLNPIEHHQFIIDPELSGILVPESFVGETFCETRQYLYEEVYIDLGGPKPFFALGCSPYEHTGILGLGTNSSLWGVFSGYESRGGRIKLLNTKTKMGVSSDEPLPSYSNFRTSSYTYDARNNMITGVTSYVVRSGVSGSLTGFFMLFMYTYMREKTTRKLVYSNEEGWLSRIARVVFPLATSITVPVMMEYYETRSLLTQDIGMMRSLLISVMLYFCAFLIIVHQIVRLIIYSNSKYSHPGWIARIELMGNLVIGTTSALASWFTLLWFSPADSGHPIPMLLLGTIFYEQTEIFIVSLCRLKSSKPKDPLMWSLAWIFGVLVPVYGTTMWLTYTYGIFPYVRDAFVVGHFQIYISALIGQAGIIYLASIFVNTSYRSLNKKNA